MENTLNLTSLSLRDAKTYLFAALFVAGNVIFPQLCHLLPMGGHIWLPIYLFTLIGAYKYGFGVGLLTAVVSPLLNSAIFSMPAEAALPGILTKSILLALAAGFAAKRFKSVSIALMALVVLIYQVLGSGAEWIYSGSFAAAKKDFQLGIPGMLLQIFGGFAFVKYLLKK